MSLLVSMSLAGTVPIAVYYLLRAALKGCDSLRRSMRLLKLSMFFYLCPFQLLKYILPQGMPDFLYYSAFSAEREYLSLEGFVAVPSVGGRYTLQPVWKVILGAVWAAAAAGFAAYQLIKYVRIKRTLLKTSERVSEEPIQTMLDNEKDSGRKRICCVRNENMKTPFTIGIFRHWIILPGREFTQGEREMILRHELAHIRNRDILNKTFCLGIVLLHWFNPAAWLLFHEYGAVAELLCDEDVASALTTKEQKKTYALLLVRLASKEAEVPVAFADYFSSRKKKIRRRIDTIMKSVKSQEGKKRGPVFAVLLLLSVFLSSLTAIAYQKDWSASREEFDGAREGDFVYFEDGYIEAVQALPFSDSDSIFIPAENLNESGQSGDGGSGAGEETSRQKEGHLCVSGMEYKHYSDQYGGCSVLYYQIERCEKCGTVISEKYAGNASFFSCPH